MPFEHNIKIDEIEEALVDIGNDVWGGFDSSSVSLGYIVTDEGDIAQVQITAVTEKESWLSDDKEVPEYTG